MLTRDRSSFPLAAIFGPVMWSANPSSMTISLCAVAVAFCSNKNCCVCAFPHGVFDLCSQARLLNGRSIFINPRWLPLYPTPLPPTQPFSYISSPMPAKIATITLSHVLRRTRFFFLKKKGNYCSFTVLPSRRTTKIGKLDHGTRASMPLSLDTVVSTLDACACPPACAPPPALWGYGSLPRV